MFIFTSIPVPGNLKHIVKEMIVGEKTLDIRLGRKYFYQKVKEPIYQNFIRFKKNIEKRLTDESIEEDDINQIVSLIDNKHAVISEKNEIDVCEEYEDNVANTIMTFLDSPIHNWILNFLIQTKLKI